jgi:transposase
MRHKKGPDRRESQLFPACIDDYLPSDSAIRLLDSYVSGLNLKELGFKHAEPTEMGRPPYDPADLLRLYLYGYLNRVCSARKLEREANRNIELMWLLRQIRPDFKTISRFRQDNGEAIQRLFAQFIETCRRLRAFDGELLAIDGSRFKAVNSRDRVESESQMKKRKERIKESIRRYFEELDRNDEAEGDCVETKLTPEEFQEKMRLLEEEMKKIREAEKKLKESGSKSVCLTDPDSRLMRVGEKTVVGYNVQLAVDSKYKLITSFEVSNARADCNHLSSLAAKAKKALRKRKIRVVADSGYYDSEEIMKCDDQSIETFIPKPVPRSVALYPKDSFVYVQRKDVYICPTGKEMEFIGTRRKGKDRMVRCYSTPACQQCLQKSQCSTSPRGREIQRLINESALEQMHKRVVRSPGILKKRKAIVEHVFGCIKTAMNQGSFLTKGLKNVTTEFTLSAIAFNLKRLISIFGSTNLVRAV